MPFIDEINAVGDKLPAGRLPRPVLAGIAFIAVAIVVLAALGVAPSARGDFVVGNSASSSSAAKSDSENQGDVQSSPGDASSTTGVSTESDKPASAATPCYVYVVGAVKHPGVYEVPPDARVNDAVALAGGLTKKADESAVNLARAIVDGEQITIPEKGASISSSTVEPASQAGGSSAYPEADGTSGKVNLNVATSEELQSLPGIGEATAAKIIASRESEGPFNEPDDLKRVSGIGDKKYAAIKDLVTV